MWPKKVKRSGKRVDFWLSDPEHAALKNKATLTGLTMSDLIRHAIEKTQTWTVKDKKIELKKIREVISIGNNLNQIARFCNTYKANTDTCQIEEMLFSIEHEIKDIFGI